MPSVRRLRALPALVVLYSLHGLSQQALGQFGAVAFEPIVAPALSGQTLTTTPVVSPDRRYVRLSVNGYFNAVNGFTNFTTPLGAVSGGGGLGGAGGGGLGGAGGGGLGGAGGGGMGGGGGAAIFSAGMNGVLDSSDRNNFSNGPAALGGFSSDLKAGPLPPWDGLATCAGSGTRLTTEFAPAWVQWGDGDDALDQIGRRATAMHSQPEERSARQEAGIEQQFPKPRQRGARLLPSTHAKAKRSRQARIAEANDVDPIVKPKQPD